MGIVWGDGESLGWVEDDGVWRHPTPEELAQMPESVDAQLRIASLLALGEMSEANQHLKSIRSGIWTLVVFLVLLPAVAGLLLFMSQR